MGGDDELAQVAFRRLPPICLGRDIASQPIANNFRLILSRRTITFGIVVIGIVCAAA